MNKKILISIIIIAVFGISISAYFVFQKSSFMGQSAIRCGDGVCGPVENQKGICPKDCGDINSPADDNNQIDVDNKKDGDNQADIDNKANNNQPVISKIDPMYFTINVHMEPSANYCNNKEYYNNAKIILNELMETAESVGAKLSVFSEYPAFYGASKFESNGDNIFIDLISRGHSVGLHSHYGSFFKQGNTTKNHCASTGEFKELTPNNYISHIESIVTKALGKNIYSEVKTVYGDAGTSLKTFVSNGIKATYFEPCSFPEAGSNAEYCTSIGYVGTNSVPQCSSKLSKDSSSNILLIPTTKGSAYLSSIYTRNPKSSCYAPNYASSATCGKWYQEDFDLVYSAVEKAIELPKKEESVNSIGITFHDHNFGDESKTTGCVVNGFIIPDYEELDMFKKWLKNKISPLKNSGELKFTSVNDLIKIVEAK